MSVEANTPNDDWLEEGVAENLERTVFPTPPISKPLPPKPEPVKQKTLADLGINTKGGVIRDSGAPVVHRTELENPVSNPKPKANSSARTGKSSALDSGDFTPEFGVPNLMTSMDANFEERANQLARQAVLPAARAEPEPEPVRSSPTGDTTLRELLALAKANNGMLKLGATHFTLEIQLR